ncbi:hypothetical protein [Halopelagius longus]|uniref:Uncharacterized protein n=1 Tax=Halopelagius longus TaxID=1236180 RepID=A0A1H1G8T2_9EURY|nr:hypothetical protein [Halopelagius longus]SDR09644.1 hypothetical protein SAMN05216278_3597 [Halopelagius longus]
MERRRLNTLVGLALVALGLLQAVSFAIADDWIFSFGGVLYAIGGMYYLWVEVYSTAQ